MAEGRGAQAPRLLALAPASGTAVKPRVEGRIVSRLRRIGHEAVRLSSNSIQLGKLTRPVQSWNFFNSQIRLIFVVNNCLTLTAKCLFLLMNTVQIVAFSAPTSQISLNL